MGNLWFPEFMSRLGIRESDNALLLGGGAAIIPGAAEITLPASAGTLAALGLAQTFTAAQTFPSTLTATAVGAVTTAATTVAVEHGDGVDHLTVLTLTAFAVGTSGDSENLAIGAKFYTFPAGSIAVENASIVGGVTAAISVTTDTPEVGIGTVIGSGDSATLSTTMEDIIDGGAAGFVGGDAVAPDVAGGAFFKGSLNSATPVLIKSTGGKARDLFLNVADDWTDVTAAGAVTFTGTITLRWRII